MGRWPSLFAPPHAHPLPQLEAAWARVKQAQVDNTVYDCECFGVNRGGLLVMCEGIKAFLPTSQMSQGDRENLEKMVGQTVRAKVMEADPAVGRLLMSTRRAAEAAEKKRNYAVGDVLLGVVQNVQVYGAFIDVQGGASGLLHISQVSQERIVDLSKVLIAGAKIKVMVLAQDQESGKLSFTTRKLEPQAGDMLRNPQRVFDRAEEMAALFRERVTLAEAAAAADEQTKAAPARA